VGSAIAVSPDGKVLASAKLDEQFIQVWDISTRRQLHQFPKRVGPALLAFSPDGRVLAGACGQEIGLWDVASGRQRFLLKGTQLARDDLAFSPDGRVLATAGISLSTRAKDEGVCLWDVATGSRLRAFGRREHDPGPVAFSADGRTVAAGTTGAAGPDTGVWLWEAATGQERRRF